MFTESELVIWNGNVYANDNRKIFKKFIEGARGLVGYSIDDKYLMQSTGLFDKNSKEIFEGDVVSFEDASDNENVFVNQGAVEIHQLGWHFSNRVSVDMEDLLNGHALDCEVIGNIYENPELIEEANNVDD